MRDPAAFLRRTWRSSEPVTTSTLRPIPTANYAAQRYANTAPSAHEAARAAGIAAGIAIPVVLILFALATWVMVRRRRAAERRGRGGAAILPPPMPGEDKYACAEGQVLNVTDGAVLRIPLYPENGVTPFPYTPAPEWPRSAPRRGASTDSGVEGTKQPAESHVVEAATRTAEVTVPVLAQAPMKASWRGGTPRKVADEPSAHRL